MENVRCPGCGASVRPLASWCSLCYLDLRGKSQLVAAVDARQDAPGDAGIAAPLVDAALEPAAVRLVEIGASGRDIADISDDDISDADIVDDPQPSAGGSPPAPRHWPCGCGAEVPLEQDDCPACGAAFLGELRGEVGGRHRQDARTHLRWLPQSPKMRLCLAALVAVVIAVVVPGLLALIG